MYPNWKPEKSQDGMYGVTIHRAGAWLRYPANSILRRAVLELWYSLHSMWTTLKIRKEVDFAIFIFPPSLYALSTTIFLPKSVTTIGIIHDLQSVYASLKNGLFSKLLTRIIHAIENKSFRQCKRLIFLSESMRRGCLKTSSLEESRTICFYPFVTLLPKSPSSQNLADIFPPSGKSLVYSGALSEKQAPDLLIKFMLSVLETYQDFRALIFSQGPDFERLKLKHDHPRLIFLPLVPQEHLPELLKKSDIQIIPQAAGTSGGSLPSKLPNLIQAGCKILCITDENSELGRIVSEYSLGYASYTWNTNKNLEAVKFLANIPRLSTTNDKEIANRFLLDNLISYISSAKESE